MLSNFLNAKIAKSLGENIYVGKLAIMFVKVPPCASLECLKVDSLEPEVVPERSICKSVKSSVFHGRYPEAQSTSSCGSPFRSLLRRFNTIISNDMPGPKAHAITFSLPSPMSRSRFMTLIMVAEELLP